VAEAVLHAAAHPARDVFVGGGGKVISVAGQRAPRTTDRIMRRVMFDTQQTGVPARASRPDGLYQSSGALRERGGYPGHVAESSLYTRASRHPLLSGVLLVGAGVLTAALVRRRWDR
jgi:hypothetical protein